MNVTVGKLDDDVCVPTTPAVCCGCDVTTAMADVGTAVRVVEILPVRDGCTLAVVTVEVGMDIRVTAWPPTAEACDTSCVAMTVAVVLVAGPTEVIIC